LLNAVLMTRNLPDLLIPETALSVSGLTHYIASLLESDDQLRQIWVAGEVSSANYHSRGLFFTLQDPDAEASIKCVVWNAHLNKLVTRPEAGEQVVILASIQLYAARGVYQLKVWQVLPGGEGLRALRYRQLRYRLEAEGLFDRERKRPLPTYPKTIAVVTSPQAAAWGDIQRTLRRRYPGLQVLLSPAIVQGEQAPGSIVQAIRRVAQDGRAEVLILARGGGAVEDLACFNDERVVRAIATCPIPVVSGIGHQRDESLADLAADLCAHTPTAAAEQAVPKLVDVLAAHQERSHRLHRALHIYLDQRTRHLERLQERLRRIRPDRQVQREWQTIHWLRQRLRQVTGQQLHDAELHCQMLRQKLVSLDPTAVLQRGYAVVRQGQGTLVRSSAQVQPGEPLTLQLAEGWLQVQVIEPIEFPFSSCVEECL
jgi:exodeoxyribonuclease VII large subunit